jgi:hypothetical protein
MTDKFNVEGWQFIEQRFTPRLVAVSEQEAWAYVKAQIDAGKDIGRFRVIPAIKAAS